MRIAVLTNAYPPRAAGGAGRIAFVYNELLRSHDHEIRVWGPCEEFYQFSNRRLPQRILFHVRNLLTRSSTVQEILVWKPDLLLTHNLTGCGLGTPSRIQSTGVCWIHVLHDVQLFEPSGQIVYGESARWFRQMIRFCWSLSARVSLKSPDAVISPTKWLLDLHRSFGFFRHVETRVVPNPVGAGASACPGPSVQPGRPQGVAASDRRILYVGRLDPDKGVDLLLEAWKTLHVSAAKLVLIGDGSLRRTIESMADPSIVVLGPRSPDEVMQTMRESDVVVVPSRVLENQPTVILEAAVAGCRIVATEVGGVRETMGEAGILIPPNDAGALANAIHRALTEPQTEHEQLEREALVKHHDPEVVVEALLGLLRSNLKM